MSRSSAVDFTLRANITDLKSELGKIPGITDKEARKMAGAMEKGLLRAEKAAKKASQAMRGDLGKSVDQAIEKTRNLATAAGVSEESFEKLKTSATNVAGQVDGFADKAGRADSSLSAMAGAIYNVNPELAELTRQAGDALGAVEGLILAAAQSPATFALTAAAVGGLYLAYGDLNSEKEKNQKLMEKHDAIQKRISDATNLQAETTENLRLKVAAMRGENTEIADQYEDQMLAIDAVVARFDRLARQGKISQSLARETRDWAIEQHKLNEELFQYSTLQEKINRQNALAVESAKLMQIVSDDRIVSLRAEITELENLGDTERAFYAQQQLDLTMAEAKASAWAAAQNQTLAATRAARTEQGLLNDELQKSPGQYAKLIREATVTRDALEDLTGSTFDLIDANGNIIHSVQDWNRTAAQSHDWQNISLGLYDKQTDKIYTAAEAVALEAQIKKKATAEAIQQNKDEADSARDNQNARIAAANSELAAIVRRTEGNVDALEQDKITEAQRLDIAEFRALEELRILGEQLDAESALTLEKLDELMEAEDLIRREFETRRADNMARIAAEELEAKEAGLAALKKAQEEADAEAIASAKARAAEIETAISASTDGLASISGDISDFMEGRYQEIGAANKKAAMEAFKIAKAAAISEAIISGYQSVSSVWATHSATPPVAIGLSALSAAAVALQVAKIRSEKPSFHAGGIMPASDPSEFSARILPGESVLNQRATAALGESGVNALNHGTASPSIQVVPVPVYKHFDRFIRDEHKRQGRFTDIVRSSSTRAVGQRGY